MKSQVRSPRRTKSSHDVYVRAMKRWSRFSVLTRTTRFPPRVRKLPRGCKNEPTESNSTVAGLIGRTSGLVCSDADGRRLLLRMLEPGAVVALGQGITLAPPHASGKTQLCRKKNIYSKNERPVGQDPRSPVRNGLGSIQRGEFSRSQYLKRRRVAKLAQPNNLNRLLPPPDPYATI